MSARSPYRSGRTTPGARATDGPGESRTVTRSLDEISYPAGVTLDPTQIRAVWVFLNTEGDVRIDNIRSE
jgi:hypothetical protein